MRRSIVWMLPLALAGCGDKPAPARTLPVPPAERLVCPDEPTAPTPPYTDEATGEYMASLRKSWQGCRQDVDWLRLWFKSLQGK